MTILNWGSSVGNRTIDTNGFFLIPETEAQRFARTGVPLPADLVGKNDYGLGFQFTVSPEGTGTFLLDSDGLKRPSGFAPYSPPITGNDYLEAIGYPPGVLSSGVYSNALHLTTIRMGDGNDIFRIFGDKVTQSIRAEVSIDASQGYIFQSNIFAGNGDDIVRALMPWQSEFRGGANTRYFDKVFDPKGTGIAITLGKPLTIGGVNYENITLEEIPYGDLIELKGSRFDWDIEFKDGNGDGKVTLASILDERDYIATSNNNRIYGFERILFGDILFDLILARQQDSSAVYGQPDYYLNGAENQAPELNSNIVRGAGLWEAFRFNRTKLEGIRGSAVQPIKVHTGDARDTPFLVGALQFASLYTEGGDDIVEIGNVDRATVDLGRGSNLLRINGSLSRSRIAGGDQADSIFINASIKSTIKSGNGSDYVEVLSSAVDTLFDGGRGLGDVLVLPGTLADFNLTTFKSRGTLFFGDVFGNTITGFELIQFSDINLDILQRLKLDGPRAPVKEGVSAVYTVSLIGSGLARDESTAFSLQLGNGTAQYLTDLAELVPSLLQPVAGVTLGNVSVDQRSGLIRAFATAKRDFNSTDVIATLALPVLVDLLNEKDETFTVTLNDYIKSQTVSTTIKNQLSAGLQLSGPARVQEGDVTSSYSVLLGQNGSRGASGGTQKIVSIGQGQGFDVTIGLTGKGGASVGKDYQPLTGSDLKVAEGLVVSEIKQLANGGLSFTLASDGSQPVNPVAPLVQFSLQTNADKLVEKGESIQIALASRAAGVKPGQNQLNTLIIDTSSPEGEPPPDGGGDGGGVEPPPRKDINGTAGPDVLTGSLLNNVIYGGKGADLLTGGGGSNVFRFNLRDGLDQGDLITDFRPGTDVIRLEGVPRNSLAAAAFGGKPSVKVGNSKTVFQIVDTLDGSDRPKAVFLYARLTGELAYNSNAIDPGFGRSGGVIANLPVLLPFGVRDLQLSYSS